MRNRTRQKTMSRVLRSLKRVLGKKVRRRRPARPASRLGSGGGDLTQFKTTRKPAFLASRPVMDGPLSGAPDSQSPSPPEVDPSPIGPAPAVSPTVAGEGRPDWEEPTPLGSLHTPDAPAVMPTTAEADEPP